MSYIEYDESEKEKEKAYFYNWCSIADSFKAEPVVGMEVNPAGDIHVKWKSGHELNTFLDDSEAAV